ncbi:hypothetical protein QY049_03580 [Bradyrhizobium sp. WYCCWR 13022]|uniref:hypothetical protein n=1 Tax=unclassified Bradyrhizobium TaxID=2631580 RepID=UPI00263B2452|nr:hypothetical protein [Bradyrhizobium sp. WYCCWR 13022]MDN4982304.1 hypothetical protein [Bradyrhizobium sp. WYCCWR 13022]
MLFSPQLAIRRARSAASGGGTTPTTWNAGDSTNVTLTGSNLIATVGSGSGGVRGVASLSTGKYYFEYTYAIHTNSFNTGIALASASVTGSTGTGIAYVTRSSGGIFVNGTDSGSALGLIAQGAVVGIAVDFSANLIWFRIAPSGAWNGDGSANPATGVGGVDISSISSGPLFPIFFGASGDAVTANFGATSFTGSVPSGFSSGFLG